jgi:hypothetical protein
MYQTINGTVGAKFTAHVCSESVTIFCSMGLRLRFRSVCVCKGALTWRSHSRAHALLHVCISSHLAELWAGLLRTGPVVTGFERCPFSSTICTGYCKVSLFWRDSPPMGQGLLIHGVSRSHITTHHSRQNSYGRVINSSQRPLPDNT